MAARASSSKTRIGISGWTYAPWRGVFFPSDLPRKSELHYASRALNTIEINGTFYSMQRPSSFAHWHAQTPDDFVFAVKGGRYITHMKRLVGVETALANFFASGVLRLKEKLGPILWQLPPQLAFDEKRIGAFLKLLPRTTSDAAKLARKHDDRLKGRSHTNAEGDRPLRHAMEVRHESYASPAFVKLLRDHAVALVVADTAGKWPYMEDVTADFVYARLHGDTELYASGYTDAALKDWAARFRAWRQGGEPRDAKKVLAVKPARRPRDVFVYFDNDVKVRAPFDAASLAAKLGVRSEISLGAPLGVAQIEEVPRAQWPAVPRKVPHLRENP